MDYGIPSSADICKEVECFDLCHDSCLDCFILFLSGNQAKLKFESISFKFNLSSLEKSDQFHCLC